MNSPAAAVMFPAMLTLGRLLGLLAAILLVIGGAPSVAAAQTCNPCPADCPMMKAAAANHGSAQTPAKGSGKGDSPCQQMAACQAVTATAATSGIVTFAPLEAASVAHQPFEPLQTPSRPPDRNLRPPIQL